MTQTTPENFKFRQIHLDFHTSEHIEDVAADFDAKEFVATLKDSAVDSVTLFARCHHGWSYYPTKVGKPHPHLKKADLLGDMVAACKKADIQTPIYLTVQWDELAAREHPEWRVMQAQNRAANYPDTEPSAMNQLTPTWHTLCLNHKGYIDYLIDMTKEVCEAYAPPALFMDILGSWECTCGTCLNSMQKNGLDPTKADDRQANDKDVLLRFFERFTNEINGDHPDVRIFYNSGHVHKGQKERYQYFGQMELESLPTGGWGYDHFPASARYAANMGLPFLGMTGKFHTHWGEFGGFKSSSALIFECCQMVSMGARCSIGDQLHPRGVLDPAAYKIIKPAYERVRALEPFAHNAEYRSEMALFSVEAQQASLSGHLGHQTAGSDTAAARMMLELQLPFDVVEEDCDFSKYKLLVLPDEIRINSKFKKKLVAYLANGGNVIATGHSGLSVDNSTMALDVGVELSKKTIEYDPSFLRACGNLDDDLPDSSIVMYQKPVSVKVIDAEVLAHIRPSYFNRTWDKFCSHLHSPEDVKADNIGPAIVQKGNCIYSAYPLFELYGVTGQAHYKYLFRGMIKRLLPDNLIGTDLPSAARMSLMEQKEESRQILHLLYAPTQNRGSGMSYNDGHVRPVEVIEDAPIVEGAHVYVRMDVKPIEVTHATSGKTVAWHYNDASRKLHIDVPRFHIHTALVIR